MTKRRRTIGRLRRVEPARRRVRRVAPVRVCVLPVAARWPDSVFEPQVVGGPEKLEELCRMADASDVDLSVVSSAPADLPLDDPLNDYVEAHVHGGLLVARDVEAVVADPTDRDEHASALKGIGCDVEEHPGYRVTADAIDPGYRGPVPVELARLLGGEITPARLAAASRSVNHDPQAVKWLWHCLARFGRRWPGRSS